MTTHGLPTVVPRETANSLETRMDTGGPAGTRTQDQRIMSPLDTGHSFTIQRISSEFLAGIRLFQARTTPGLHRVKPPQ